MRSKPLIRLGSAQQDERDIVAHYAAEAGLDVALRFTEALRDAYRFIGKRPGLGSLRFGHQLGFPGLRARKPGRFPYLIFYMEREDQIEVWRVLHAQRDIASELRDEQS